MGGIKSKATDIQIIKREDNGKVNIICQEPKGTKKATNYLLAVEIVKKMDKKECPYSYRYV